MNHQGLWPGLCEQLQEIIFDLESALGSNLNYLFMLEFAGGLLVNFI